MPTALIASTSAVLGPAFAPKRIKAFNRTGGAITANTVRVLDLVQSATETTNILEGDEASIWGNVVAYQPATFRLDSIPVVCQDASVGDNEKGEWLLWGHDVDVVVTSNATSVSGQGMMTSSSASAPITTPYQVGATDGGLLGRRCGWHHGAFTGVQAKTVATTFDGWSY